MSESRFSSERADDGRVIAHYCTRHTPQTPLTPEQLAFIREQADRDREAQREREARWKAIEAENAAAFRRIGMGEG